MISSNPFQQVKKAMKTKIVKSSGNVFADLDVTDPDQAMAKAELARHISSAIRSRDLTQTKAAEFLGIDQPKISALMCGRLAGFSTDRLLRILNALGLDVEIRVQPKSEPRSAIRVYKTSNVMVERISSGRKIENKNHSWEITKKASIMSKPRNIYKYQFKVGNQIVHGGITNDLDRRGQEHQQNWSSGHIKQVGRRTTEEAARKWEKKMGYS